jgi:hypothetical protein
LVFDHVDLIVAAAVAGPDIAHLVEDRLSILDG